MREYDLTTACKWIGNSPAVGAKHYAMSIDLNADYRRAAGPEKAQQKAQQSAATSDDRQMTDAASTDEKSPRK
jgi:hypothetical protein